MQHLHDEFQLSNTFTLCFLLLLFIHICWFFLYLSTLGSRVRNSMIPSRLEEKSRDICFHFNLTRSWYSTNSFFAACTNWVRHSLFNGRDFQRAYPLWRIARHTWISLRMDRARESQSTGELILSVPNCIYWPCLAPPNPGLWWCINSCDWLFTRHLLAGVNITRQIPPITLITPLPGLCRLPRAEPRWRKGQGCAEADSHFLALAIATLQSDYLLSNCQPSSEVMMC